MHCNNEIKWSMFLLKVRFSQIFCVTQFSFQLIQQWLSSHSSILRAFPCVTVHASVDFLHEGLVLYLRALKCYSFVVQLSGM
jgi:hypothetical protein